MDEPGDRAAALVQDWALAGLVGAVSLVALWDPPPFVTYDYREADALGVALVLAACGSLVARRRSPVAAVLVSTAASLALTQLGYSGGLVAIATLLCLYSVAAGRDLRTSLAVGAVVAAAVGVVLLTGPLDPTLGDWLSNMFVLGTAWAVGRSVRTRRRHHADVQARNAAELEAQRAETRTLLAEERARTAREMQDLVAHNLTEVSVQVAAARRLLARDPESAYAVLLDAERVSRAAMDEMRRVGGMLGRPGEAVDLRPQPSLADVAELVHARRACGADVELSVEGATDNVPAGVGLTAYRVVAEALANAHRHSAGVPVRVGLAREDDALTLSVASAPAPRAPRWTQDAPADSTTLPRLRARVAAYGGELTWGRRRDGGFAVRARFPLTEPPQRAEGTREPVREAAVRNA